MAGSKPRFKLTAASLGTAKKAIVGGVTAGIGSLTTAIADGSVTVVEVVVAVLTGVVAGLGVYQTTNDAPIE